jgi:hypothetical protein
MVVIPSTFLFNDYDLESYVKTIESIRNNVLKNADQMYPEDLVIIYSRSMKEEIDKNGTDKIHSKW